MEHRAVMAAVSKFRKSPLDHEKIAHLRQTLSSRLQANKKANQYAKLLGLYRLPPIEMWIQGLSSLKYDYETSMEYSEQIARSGLFQASTCGIGRQGLYYWKPSQHLAAGMASACYNKWEVKDAIDFLLQSRLTDHITAE
jgi:hypothetical protein